MSSVSEHYGSMQSPISDFVGLMGNCQHLKKCRGLELNVLDCMDVYGHKGLLKHCKNEFDDYNECLYGIKQAARVEAMQAERMRQYLAGERPKKNFYAKRPVIDGYEETYNTTLD